MDETERAALIEAALRIVQHWARSRHARIERRALDTAEALGFDPDDVYAVLVATDASCVRKIEADEQYPERTVIVMNLTASERSLYVKVSLNLQINHDVRVLSFKDWST